jgi:hypothetical protein
MSYNLWDSDVRFGNCWMLLPAHTSRMDVTACNVFVRYTNTVCNASPHRRSFNLR